MCIGWIRFLILVCVTVTQMSCSRGSDDELADIAGEVLKRKEGIRMEFTPMEKVQK